MFAKCMYRCEVQMSNSDKDADMLTIGYWRNGSENLLSELNDA